MRIGTDAVLLGSWAEIQANHNYIDVGTGCGVIACMLAQKGGIVWGVDIDRASVEEAKQNSESLPFINHPKILLEDFFKLEMKVQIQGVISNPPFFIESLRSNQISRDRARHLTEDWLVNFWLKCKSLVTDVQIIVPFDVYSKWKELAHNFGFNEFRICEVYSFESDSSPVRVLCHFRSRNIDTVKEERLVLYDKKGKRSGPYTQLCAEFYL
jgi:tRNA1Val (adenine37-N6)-methyltransferase